MSGRRALRVARAAATAFAFEVFVKPVREGRLRDLDWPLGLRVVVVVGLVGYGVAAALIVFSGPLREWLPLSAQSGLTVLSLPRAVVWLVLALTALSMTLAVAGALHAKAWFRWLTIGVMCLVLVVAASPDQRELPTARIVALAASAGLVLLAAVRGHRRYAWGEFAIATVLIWGSLAFTAGVLTAVNRGYGFDFVPVLLSLMLTTIGQLAIPAALAAGASVASFTVSAALWSAKVVRDVIGVRAVHLVLGLVAVWRVVDLVLNGIALGGDASVIRPVLLSLALLVLIGLAWWGLSRVRAGRGTPSLTGMIDRVDNVALVVSAFSTTTLVTVLLDLVAYCLLSFGAAQEWVSGVLAVAGVMSMPTVLFVGRGCGAVALLVLAVVQARRGRRTMPELYAALGIASLLISVSVLTDFSLIWSTDWLALIAAAAALVLLVVQLVRRELTGARAASLLVALLMSALFAYRDFVTDPIAFLLGFAGAAVVLFGFVWSFLTDNGDANDDSPAYPRHARVQLVLANALFGLTVLAFISLARDPDAAVALGDFADYGAQAFGDPLVASGLLLALWAAVRGREVEAELDAGEDVGVELAADAAADPPAADSATQDERGLAASAAPVSAESPELRDGPAS
ncbi:MAG: hypothetical protein QM675_08980 [Protaetiibacter sp.]